MLHEIQTNRTYNLIFSDGTTETKNALWYGQESIQVDDEYMILIIDGKKYKLNENGKGFTYQIRQKKININDINSFIKYISDTRNAESVFCHDNLIEKIQEKVLSF